MFDIGFLEILMIGVVSLLVIGPERLPEVAAKVGKAVGKAQRFVRGVRSDISRELESGDLKDLLGDQKKQIEELRQMVHSASKDIESSTSTVMKDAEKSFEGLNNSIAPPKTSSTAASSVAGLASDSLASDSSASDSSEASSSEASSNTSEIADNTSESVVDTNAQADRQTSS